eukprot:g4012.t1
MRAARAAAAASAARKSPPNYGTNRESSFVFNGKRYGDDFAYNEDDYDTDSYGSYDDGDFGNNFEEDIESFLSRPPPSANTFAKMYGAPNLKQLRAERNQLRRIHETEAPSKPTGPSSSSPTRSGSGEIDYALLQEAFAYSGASTAQIRSDRLMNGGQRDGRNVKRKGKKKKMKARNGKGRSKAGTRSRIERAKKNAAIYSKRRKNTNIKKNREWDRGDRQSKQSNIDYEKLKRNFETGSELKRLRAELEKSNKSKADSLAFLQSAKGLLTQ